MGICPKARDLGSANLSIMPSRAFRRRLALPLALAAFVIPAAGQGSAQAQAACAPVPASAVQETEDGIWDEGLHPAGDLDGDGRPDALHVSETSLTGVRGHDGATLWTSSGAVDSVYRAGDLDNAPGADLIVVSNNTTHAGGAGQVREYVFRGFSGATGATLWTRAFPSLVNLGGARHEGGISVLSAPTDLDGDGVRDLLLGQYFQEADTMFTRGLFESMSGKTGLPITRYGAGIGSWYHPLNGPSRQLPFAVVVPDLTGDCLADVVVNASRLSVSAIQAFPGKGGAPVWHVEIQHEGMERVLEVTGAQLTSDAKGDVLLSVGAFGNGTFGSEVELVALSGADGTRAWASVFPQNMSRLTLQPAADGSGDDILLSGPFARSLGTLGMVDGSTGTIRWQRAYQDGWPFLAGDATGDGIGDIVLRHQQCVQGCRDTEALLISASDGSIVWSREAVQAEELVEAGDDLDGDGRNDLFAFRDGVENAPSFYTAVSGKDGSALWPGYRRMDEVVSILRVAPLDIRPNHPGVDVLEGFRADDHATGPAARPGTGGAPIWVR